MHGKIGESCLKKGGPQKGKKSLRKKPQQARTPKAKERVKGR